MYMLLSFGYLSQDLSSTTCQPVQWMTKVLLNRDDIKPEDN